MKKEEYKELLEEILKHFYYDKEDNDLYWGFLEHIGLRDVMENEKLFDKLKEINKKVGEL